MSSQNGASYSAARIATRVAALGKEVSREYKGRRLDVVVTLDRGFVFAADLMRQIDAPIVCHFVREDVRDVDAVLESGVTQEFLLRRLGESGPRSIRLAVLLDKTARRRVALEPDYFGFRTASNQLLVGYGLAAPNGTGRNLRQLSSTAQGAPGKSVKKWKK